MKIELVISPKWNWKKKQKKGKDEKANMLIKPYLLISYNHNS